MKINFLAAFESDFVRCAQIWVQFEEEASESPALLLRRRQILIRSGKAQAHTITALLEEILANFSPQSSN